MNNEFKFKEIIDSIVEDILRAKKNSENIHYAGNIKSSGDEVEDLIREKISLFLPDRYLVKQGHIVNSNGKVSPQLDIIIFDRLSTPKFFESKNNTVFYPIESVLAIGEIKKTLREKDILEFRKKIKFIKQDMNRILIENPVYGGKIGAKATLFDVVNLRVDRKFKNPLFSFVFAIDVADIDKVIIDDSYQFLPNDIYVLNHGFIVYSEKENDYIKTMIEDENPRMDTWIHVKSEAIICLGMLFTQLIEHLNKCVIRPFGITDYVTKTSDFKLEGKEVRIIKFNDKQS